MGFTRTALTRKAAYEASLASAGLIEAPPQKQATARTNLVLMEALPKQTLRLLQVNAAGRFIRTSLPLIGLQVMASDGHCMRGKIMDYCPAGSHVSMGPIGC